jgi:hypothetical protein
MTTVDALKALYVKKGGALTDTYDGIAGGAKVRDYSTIPDMIQAITQKEAASLPATTTDDNGKVLTVSGGVWSAVTPTPELPVVNADDNGKVLKVADGAWGIGTDLTE